jgi:conjugal transfer pilus assembly protein TraB
MSMNNLNIQAKKKQLTTLIGVILLGGAAAGIVYYFTRDDKPAAQVVQPAPKKLSGVITSVFTDEMQKSALVQQQERTALLEKQVKELQEKLNEQPSGDTQTIAQLRTDVEALGKKLNAQAPGQSNGPSPVGQPEVKWNVQDANSNPNPPQFPAGQGQNNYVAPAKNTRPQIGGIKHTSIKWEAPKETGNKLPWISSGSFINASMIEGADANASVTGQQASSPVVFTLLGNASLPNGQKYNLDQCRVTGEIWGDISSERGEVRTDHISCNLPGNRHVDMAFKGHVSYQGKEGIRGKPVMRNGKIVAYAGAAGALSGLGSGISESGTTSVGIGATATAGAGEIARQALGGGASKAADTLSQYWIKRAEQYHPVIDIGAGNAVTVVFQEGFQLSTIEDAIAAKSESAADDAVDNVAGKLSSDDTPDTSLNDGARTLTTLPSSDNGKPKMINPDDIIRKARNLDLGAALSGK